MNTWTFGAGGQFTATWDGTDTLTVTVTATGAFVESFSGQSLSGLTSAPAYLTLAALPALPTGAAVLPYLAVSPVGLAGGAAVANNGAAYGPDSPGTTTCGIQEALNALPACQVYDGGSWNLVSGKKGSVTLLPGVFQTSGPVVFPSGDITFEGAGQSSWISVAPIASPTMDLGGSVIVGSDFTHSVVSVPTDVNGLPSTTLRFRDLEIRLASPASAQTSSAPAVLSMPGLYSGEVSNVSVLEVNASTGLIGHNMFIIADFSSGTNKDDVILRNIRGYGGNTGVKINQAHVYAYNISGGGTGTSINASATGILIFQELENYFANFHCFSTTYGLTFHPYTPATGQPRVPQVIRGIHFESVTHYVTSATASATGMLVIEQPIWDEASPVPSTDIAANLAAQSSTPSVTAQTGLAVITRDELNNKNIASGWHVTVGPAAWTAGTSPYTFPALPYDCVFVLTTAGGMTALTLDGQALFGGTFSAGQIFPLKAGHSLIATWATTAPVFQVLPQ